MRKYSINNELVSRNTFFRRLKMDCTKAVQETQVGSFGVEIQDYDTEKYAKMQKALRAGHICVIPDKGKVYAIYDDSNE